MDNTSPSRYGLRAHFVPACQPCETSVSVHVWQPRHPNTTQRVRARAPLQELQNKKYNARYLDQDTSYEMLSGNEGVATASDDLPSEWDRANTGAIDAGFPSWLYDIEKPKVVLQNEKQSRVLLKSGEKYVIYSQSSGDLHLIQEPKTLSGILASLDEPRELSTTRIDRVTASSHPSGWQNTDLREVMEKFDEQWYGLDSTEVLMFKVNGPEALIKDKMGYLLWDRDSDQIKRVEDPIDLQKVIHRIENGVALKLSDPVDLVYPEISPKGWIVAGIEDLDEVLDAQAYGLSFVKPLFREKGYDRWLVKSEGIYLIWDEMLDSLFRIDSPNGYLEVVKRLNDQKPVKYTEIDCLESGLFLRIPQGWTDEGPDNITEKIPYHQYGLSEPALVATSLDTAQALLVCNDRTLLWKEDSGNIFAIKSVESLQEILDRLNNQDQLGLEKLSMSKA